MRFIDTLKKINKKRYTLTASKKAISQKERNAMKYDLTDSLAEMIEDVAQENGVDLIITRTIDGYIMEVQNEIIGLLPIELILKVRGIDYDIMGAEQEFLSKNDE